MGPWPYYNSRDDPLHQLAIRHPRVYRYGSWSLWGIAIVCSVGDIITTWVAVTPLFGGPYEATYESIGATIWVLNTVGPWGFVLQKAVGLSFAWGVARLFPRPYPLGVAVMAAGLNGFILFHNVTVLAAVDAHVIGWLS